PGTGRGGRRGARAGGRGAWIEHAPAVDFGRTTAGCPGCPRARAVCLAIRRTSAPGGTRGLKCPGRGDILTPDNASRGGAVWQLVGLITRRSQVRILPPLPHTGEDLGDFAWVLFEFSGTPSSSA